MIAASDRLFGSQKVNVVPFPPLACDPVSEGSCLGHLGLFLGRETHSQKHKKKVKRYA